jgi:hypothetical protein
MNCTQVRPALPLFVGGDVDVATGDDVRAHLRDCPACRAEASALQQATLRLRRLAAAPAAGVDEAMFAAMHGDVMAHVGAAAEAAPRAEWRAWPWVAAAATALLAVGFWWGFDVGDDGVYRRMPIALPAVLEPAKVVPWSGPRVVLRPLSDDRAFGADDASDGSGMLGRDRLRLLVDESDQGLVLPPRQPGNR